MNYSKAVDDYLHSEVDTRVVPGLGVAAVRSGKIIHLAGYGYSNIENHTSTGPDTIFHAGSVGKMFVAAAFLLLVQDGRVTLDDLLKAYIPEGPEPWAEITLRQLLSMMSGLDCFEETFAPSIEREGVIAINLWQDHSDEQLIELAGRSRMLFEPNKGYQYSNIGYILAGIVVARITGKPYHAFLSERLFQKIGMATAREAAWFEIVPNRAAGYRMRDGQIVNRHWAAPTLQRAGDGGLYFSPRDLAHWLVELDNPTLFRGDILETMYRPNLMHDGRASFNGYALGWQNSEIRGHRKIRHGGIWDGFRAEVVRFPEQELSICVLANMEDAQTARIAQKVAGLIDPSLAPFEPVVDANPNVSQCDANMWQSIINKRVSRDEFTDSAWQLWSNGRLGEVLRASDAAARLSSWELLHSEKKETSSLRRYRGHIGCYHLHWTITRTHDGRVSDMRFHME